MAGRSTTMTVTGLRPLIKALKVLPEKCQKKVMKSAVTKATTPVVKMARKLAPRGEGLKPDGTPREHLYQTITKTAAKIYKNGTVVVTTGPGFRKAPHSHLVDRGTKPHKIILKKLWVWNSTKFKRSFFFKPGHAIHHPGAKGVHFMDRAADAVKAKSAAIMEASISKGIEKEAAKLAAKQ